jgi:hypothetical protein
VAVCLGKNRCVCPRNPEIKLKPVCASATRDTHRPQPGQEEISDLKRYGASLGTFAQDQCASMGRKPAGEGELHNVAVEEISLPRRKIRFIPFYCLQRNPVVW